jgi:hypothetical protein
LVEIDGLNMTEEMAQWRPPLRTLLISTAAMIVAMMAHDGAARTCVACRMGPDDLAGLRAVEDLGALHRTASMDVERLRLDHGDDG